MSRALAGDEKVVRAELSKRLTAAMRRMAFFVIPAAMSFFAFGDTLAGLLYQSGRFTQRRYPLRLGAADRFWNWIGGIHLRSALFVGVLRAPRYTHASALRHCAGRSNDCSWVFVRISDSEAFASGSELGIGGFAGVGRCCRLD